MQTINGKLVIEEQPDLDKLKRNIENLAQQFERLELQIIGTNKKDKTEYLKQLTSVQESLQKLERIYSRLLSTAILTAIGLASWYVWLGFNHDAAPTKLANSRVAIATIKPAAKAASR